MSEVWELLSAPFEPGELDWRLERLSPDRRRALLVPRVEPRVLLERLDEAAGTEGWQDSYELLLSGPDRYAVKCRLTVGKVSKEDLGEADRLRDAFTEALWRAAYKFGVGRYAAPSWVDHDPATGRYEKPAGAATLAEGTHESALPELSQQEPPAPLPDPPKPEPQALIDGLMEELRSKGMGKEAARVISRYGGYGKNIDEMRKVYAELKAILKGAT